jgi:large subunit ribosomal protein L7/L12
LSVGGGGGPAAAAAPEPVKEVQTEFNVKLEGFEAASKIKVIKEIRALSELGLKEAKELV